MARPLAALAAAIAGALPAAALADADEASLSLGARAGVASLRDPLAAGQSPHRVRDYGASLRFTYATHDWFAYELRLDYGETGSTRLEGVTLDGWDGQLATSARLARLGAGMVGRFGVRWIPTLGLGVACQYREHHDGRLIDPAGGLALGRAADRHRIEPVVAGSAGFDWRLGRHLVAGAAARALWAPLPGAGFAGFELGVELGYYFYPRWF